MGFKFFLAQDLILYKCFITLALSRVGNFFPVTVTSADIKTYYTRDLPQTPSFKI